MKSYNGFSGEKRLAVDKELKQLEKEGKWTYERKCHMCGFEDKSVMYHLENYNEIFSGWPLCVECHMLLHCRYRYPNRWAKHCMEVRNGKKGKYYSVYAFIKSHEYDIPEAWIIDNPQTWWEKLKY